MTRSLDEKIGLWQEALEWIGEGHTLESFCRTHKVSSLTMRRYRAELFTAGRLDPKAVDEARTDGADVMAERLVAVLDERNVKDPDDVQHRKLKVWGMLQLLAKWHPVRYGDKVAIGGAADLPPVQLSDDQRLARLRALEEATAVRQRIEQRNGHVNGTADTGEDLLR
jgi:Bacteriophage Sf6, terminase small subunit-like